VNDNVTHSSSQEQSPERATSGGRYYFPAAQFAGQADALAEALRPLGVELRWVADNFPCHEYRDSNGQQVREIGDVVAYEDGRIHVYPGSNATDAEQVTLLRAAERVVVHGFDGPGEPGWSRGATKAGRRYRRCVVLTFPDDSSQEAAESAAITQVVDEFLADISLIDTEGLTIAAV
jgi:hypothetical protein